MKTKPGEVWLADLGIAGKVRPVLVVSRDDPNPPRVLTIYVPLTTKYRNSSYEVDLGNLPFLKDASFANVQGIGAIPSTRLDRRLGEVSSDALDQVRDAIRYALEL
jgi:mRNA interferase MazF